MSRRPTSPRTQLHTSPFRNPPRSTREPDPGVSEGVCAIIYAAPRTELKGEPVPALSRARVCDVEDAGI